LLALFLGLQRSSVYLEYKQLGWFNIAVIVFVFLLWNYITYIVYLKLINVIVPPLKQFH
jgi:hypothetical protein